MPQHFVNLPGAATLPTRQYQLAGQIIDDLITELATGVVHGPAGTGKTYAVQAALERLRDAAPGGPGSPGQVIVCTLAFPARPTMRLVADALLTALTGAAPPRSRNRFQLISALTDLLSGPRRLVVIDEAQRLNGDCIELIRHLHDPTRTPGSRCCTSAGTAAGRCCRASRCWPRGCSGGCRSPGWTGRASRR